MGFQSSGSAKLIIFALATWYDVSAKSIMDIGATTVDDVNVEISKQIAGHIPAERIDGMAHLLRDVYPTLPKNSAGRVGHQAVRYVLHRLFVKRYGWYIKGLEPMKANGSAADAAWIPSYLQDKIEEHLVKKGMDLRELASLGVALEDLVQNEVKKAITDIYHVLKISTGHPVSVKEAADALDTYAMSYLLAGKRRNVTIKGPRDTKRKRKIFADGYKNYTEFHAWFQHLEQQHNLFSTTNKVPFGKMIRIAEDFGERYGTFNDGECSALKRTLLAVEGKGRSVGRVRLSDFYNMSRYSHWKSTERVEYLRDLGALDETNASDPMVIVPNYITSRPNCLEATPLYAVCCRDECEDLLGRLERDLKAPTSTTDRISELVASYSSDTVQAPRTLPDSLKSHLQSIAALHGGKVEVHGRLFAQWMHHAFPRECAYPHEAGTINPQTADEWMKANGHASEQASDEEVQKVLDLACTSNVTDEGELPWNPTEEVLDEAPPVNALLALMLITSGLWGLAVVWYVNAYKMLRKQQHWLKVAGCALASLVVAGAVFVGVADKEIVAVVAFVGFGVQLARKFLLRQASEKSGQVQGKLV